MFVIKRDGRQERVLFDKITARINKLSYDLDNRFVEPVAVAQKVISGVYPGVKTSDLDTLAAETAAALTTQHPDYATLAARIAVSNLHKETKKVFSQVATDLYNHINKSTGKHSPLISEETYNIIQANAERLNSAIIYDRDYGYNYFGFKTLERGYLMKIDGEIVERPQHMVMRVRPCLSLLILLTFLRRLPLASTAMTLRPRLRRTTSCLSGGSRMRPPRCTTRALPARRCRAASSCRCATTALRVSMTRSSAAP